MSLLLLFLACGEEQNTQPKDSIPPSEEPSEEPTTEPTDEPSSEPTDPNDEHLLDVDNDGDGLTENEGDCDDTNADIFPDAEDFWYDGIDSNCDGNNDYDWDGDGISILEGDCNDYDSEIGTTVYRLASEYIEEDRESDGEFELILERFYDYDDSGQLSLLTVNPITDTSNTPTPRGERYYEWDDFHRLLLDKHIYTYEPVGDFDRIIQEEKTYHPNGLLASWEEGSNWRSATFIEDFEKRLYNEDQVKYFEAKGEYLEDGDGEYEWARITETILNEHSDPIEVHGRTVESKNQDRWPVACRFV